MKLQCLLIPVLLIAVNVQAQTLHIKNRRPDALSGSRFAASINDTSISLQQREHLIYRQIKAGNVPAFYRRFVTITDTLNNNGQQLILKYNIAPDYLAIGTDSDYFYCPMTPSLAQRVANKLKCLLPTRKMVNDIYLHAEVKLNPMPLPPGPQMITVAAFIQHSIIISQQRDSVISKYPQGALTAGNKKDIIISPRVYNDTSQYHVVIYGWHRLNGQAIQPLYARHLNTWADYSHGVRLVEKYIWINGKKMKLKKLLRKAGLCNILSDEGILKKPYYPTKWVNIP